MSQRLELRDGWEVAVGPLGARADDVDRLAWRPALVPGTVAGALGADVAGHDLDAEDWWFRVAFDAEAAAEGEEVLLGLDGLATLAEVYVNGSLVVESESMFVAHAIDVSDLLTEGRSNELVICCRALAPRLAEPRKPRARWRTRLVANGNLRFYRTMLLGRAPGFAPGPAVVGPWRPVWLERRRGCVLDRVRLRAALDEDGSGRLECRVVARRLAGAVPPAQLQVTVRRQGVAQSAGLELEAATGVRTATMVVAGAEPWWPHTHGEPALYEVSVGDGATVLHEARVGFRRLKTAADPAADGLQLRVNDAPVFARGAVWTPLDLQAPHAEVSELRATLTRVADGGMNMLRVPGTAAYESDAFYDLCDELGLLVWQDFMFANLDYPEADPGFMAAVRTEARAVLERLGGRPCLTVLCGGSEVAQQVAMLGLEPELADGPLYGELLPELVREAGVHAPYVPSSPWGGDLAFRTDRGIAHYFGVGAYLRPIEDARRAEVRFAAECLAIANVPDDEALEPFAGAGAAPVDHPAWKASVPRDAGAAWDFEDVRDHYLALLFGVDPVALRSVDPDRYLALSRAASGEVMAEVFGEWRRAGSPCEGALVLWLKDLAPGAGWGVLDHRGQPKVAFAHVRRALAPVAVWSTDEGLGGIDVHFANDRPRPLRARLRVALYRGYEQLVDEAVEDVDIGGHVAITRNVETLLGRFVDVSWAYRFGPPGQDLVAMSLEAPGAGADEPLAQAFRFPAGRPLTREPAADLGLEAVLEGRPDGALALRVSSRRFAYGVRAVVPGYVASDDAFGVEPGHARTIVLVRRGERAERADGLAEGGAACVTALNLAGRIQLPALDRD